MFSVTFLQILVIASLVWTGLGALVLLILLLKDKINRAIW